MEQFIKSQLLKADLIEIDSQLSESGFKDMSSMLLIKQLFLTISNLVDFEITVRPLYKENRTLSEQYKKASKEYSFAKYLRNKFVGHIKHELIEKAIEWKPELRYSLKEAGDPKMMFFFNMFVLETAINTYVNQDGSHKIFDSETDLVYKPDLNRFLNYLSFMATSAIGYLNELEAVLGRGIDMLGFSEMDREHWLAAGDTTFEYIKK